MKYKSFLVRKFNLGHLYIYIFPFCADIQFLGIPVIIDYADNRIYPSSTPSSKILFVNEYTRKYILFRLIVRLNRVRSVRVVNDYADTVFLKPTMCPRSQQYCVIYSTLNLMKKCGIIFIREKRVSECEIFFFWPIFTYLVLKSI